MRNLRNLVPAAQGQCADKSLSLRYINGRYFQFLKSLYFHMANVSLIEAPVCASDVLFRQEKESWIKAKYVERKFLKKMCGSEGLVEGSRKSHHWSVKKCKRHNSSIRAPKTRRKYRHDAGIMSPANLAGA